MYFLDNIPPVLLLLLTLRLNEVPLIRPAASLTRVSSGGQTVLHGCWKEDGVSSGQVAGNIFLEVVKDPEPPGLGEKVVICFLLEFLRCGHCVIDPPEPGGDEVGQDDVNTVVTSSHHQATDPSQTYQEGQPMESNKPSWRVCNEIVIESSTLS